MYLLEIVDLSDYWAVCQTIPIHKVGVLLGDGGVLNLSVVAISLNDNIYNKTLNWRRWLAIEIVTTPLTIKQKKTLQQICFDT